MCSTFGLYISALSKHGNLRTVLIMNSISGILSGSLYIAADIQVCNTNIVSFSIILGFLEFVVNVNVGLNTVYSSIKAASVISNKRLKQALICIFIVLYILYIGLHAESVVLSMSSGSFNPPGSGNALGISYIPLVISELLIFSLLWFCVVDFIRKNHDLSRKQIIIRVLKSSIVRLIFIPLIYFSNFTASRLQEDPVIILKTLFLLNSTRNIVLPIDYMMSGAYIFNKTNSSENSSDNSSYNPNYNSSDNSS